MLKLLLNGGGLPKAEAAPLCHCSASTHLPAARGTAGRMPARGTAATVGSSAATASPRTAAIAAAARITASARSAAVAAGATASSVRPRGGSTTISRRRIRRIAAVARSRIGWRTARRRRRVTWCWTIRRRGTSAIRSSVAIAIVSIRPLVHDGLVHIQRRPTASAAGWRTVTAVRRSCRGSIGTSEALPAGCLASVGVRGLAPSRSVIAKSRLSV